MTIHYITGDIFNAPTNGHLLCHICNDMGKWGAGFSGQLSKQYPHIEQSYRTWWSGRLLPVSIPNSSTLGLGNVQVCNMGNHFFIGNMVAQRNVRVLPSDPSPINYQALEKCLLKVAEFARGNNTEGRTLVVDMPRIGTGLAGGEWRLIEPLIISCLSSVGVSVNVYTLIGRLNGS